MKVTSTTLLFIVMALLLTGFNVQAQTATVTTDKADYHPGETLVIMGSGWLPGETVKLHLEETPALCLSGHDLYAVADTNGGILNNQFTFKESHLGVSFMLTAIGESSGYLAETLFTDANFSSVKSGNWNDPATWGLTGAPTEGVNYPGRLDIASIVSGHNVSLTQHQSCGTLMITSGIIDGISKLTTEIFNLSVNGNLTISASSSARSAELSVGTGSLDINGNILFAGANSRTNRRIVFTGTGTLGVSGSLSSEGEIHSGLGTVVFNGSNVQSITRYNYNNLTLVGKGLKLASFDVSLTGDLLVEAGAVLNLDSDITINGAKSLIINGRVNMIENGRFLDGLLKNSIYINSGGYLNIKGDLTSFPVFDGITSLHANSTVEYGARILQSARTVFAYGNLIFSGGSTKSLNTSPGVTNVRGSLTIVHPTILVTNNNVINLEGDFINSGKLEQGTGAFNLVGAEQVIGTFLAETAFTHLNIAGSGNKTFGGYVNVTNTLTLTNNLINVGVRTFSIALSGSIIGGSPSSYINGKLTRILNTIGSNSFFPVGKGGHYSPVSINYSSLSRVQTVTVESFESGFPGTLPTGTTQLGTRFWQISEPSGFSQTYEVTLGEKSPTPSGPVVILKHNSPLTVALPAVISSTEQIATGYQTNGSALTTYGSFALGQRDIASTVTVNGSSGEYGNNSVSVNASVLPVNATGNVVFYVNDVSIGTAAVTAGSATLNYDIRDVPAGLYTLRADYLGDGVYQPSTNDPDNDVALTINKKLLTVSATGINKVYDGEILAVVTLSDDRVPGDAFDTDYGDARFADKTVGISKPVTVSEINIAGPDANNYTVNTNTSTIADISQKPLTVSATGIDKIYDGEVGAVVILNDDRVSGDLITTGYAAASFNDKNVDEGKAISVTGISISGVDAANYTFNPAVTGRANISPLSVHGKFTANNKLYDGSKTATVFTKTLETVISRDEVSLTGGTATFADKAVAVGKTVKLEGATLAGADASNYYLELVQSTVANISAFPITGRFSTLDKTYDGDIRATVNNRALVGVIEADDVSLNGGMATFDDKNVGTAKVVTLTGATLTGSDAGNYSLTGVTSTSNNIFALEILGTFTAEDKIYDGNTKATVTNRSLVGDVAVDDVALDGGTATFDNKNIGTAKVVSLTGAWLAGSDAGNYSLTSVASTSNDISALEVWGTFAAEDKIYDGNIKATIINRSLVDNVATDDVSLEGGTATFENKNTGTAKLVSLAGATLAGTDAGNYTLTRLAPTTANIIRKALNIAILAENKSYDGNTTASTSATIASGLVENDVVTVAASNGGFDNKNVGTGKVVTANVSKSGADEDNYSANSTATAMADIIARPVSIKADAKSKAYGDADPLSLTYEIWNGSLVSGESFTGALSRLTGENVGSYSIQQGSIALTNNYTLTYLPADFSITPRPVSIAATPKSKYCGQPDPPLSYSIISGSLVNDDLFSGSLQRSLVEDANQTYTINQGTVALNLNYALTYKSALLTINDVSVDANASSTPQAISTAISLKAAVSPQQPGVTVNFYIDDKFIKSSLTNSSGIAELAIGSLTTNVYKIKAVVGSGCSESVVFLPVYDPNGGFVTGGGWILSPPNAYVGNLRAEGKANFGFVAKYKKGSTIPEGNTEFQFHAGNLNFNSSAYEDMRLVIAGSKANYKGTGRINGTGNYGFLVSAIDGQVNGGGNIDKFRIKIWDKNNGNLVVYDNDMGKDENDLPTTTLGGGSIVIHEVKGGKQSSITPLAEAGRGLDMKIVEPVFEHKIKLGAYPNPFGKQSTIAFTLPTDEQMVTLDVYDLKGSKVKRMYEGKAGASQTLEFGFNGSSLSPGMYLLRLTTPKKVENFKMIMTE